MADKKFDIDLKNILNEKDKF